VENDQEVILHRFGTTFFSGQKVDFLDFSTLSQTPAMMPKHSPNIPKTFWKKIIFDLQNFSGTCPEHV